MRLFYSLIFITLTSCSFKSEDQRILNNAAKMPAVDDTFKWEILKTIEEINTNDSISDNLIQDSLFLYSINNSEYQVALGQYHTDDNNLYVRIIGILNFNNESIPTYKLVDRTRRSFVPDSVTLKNDSIYIYGTTTADKIRENFKIGFDLNFNNKSFPWTHEPK